MVDQILQILDFLEFFCKSLKNHFSYHCYIKSIVLAQNPAAKSLIVKTKVLQNSCKGLMRRLKVFQKCNFRNFKD